MLCIFTFFLNGFSELMIGQYHGISSLILMCKNNNKAVLKKGKKRFKGGRALAT